MESIWNHPGTVKYCTVVESSSAIPDSGITLAAAHATVSDSTTAHTSSCSAVPDSHATHTLSAHGTIIAGDDDATSTITVSACTTALSTVTSAIGVLGAVHTPDHNNVHSSSGQAGANLSIPDDTDVDMAPPMPEHDPVLFDGKFLFFPLIFCINIYVLPEPDLDI